MTSPESYSSFKVINIISQESPNKINVLAAIAAAAIVCRGRKLTKTIQHRPDCKHTCICSIWPADTQHLCTATIAQIPQRITDSYLLLIYVFLAVLMSGFLLVILNTRPGGGGWTRAPGLIFSVPLPWLHSVMFIAQSIACSLPDSVSFWEDVEAPDSYRYSTRCYI